MVSDRKVLTCNAVCCIIITLNKDRSMNYQKIKSLVFNKADSPLIVVLIAKFPFTKVFSIELMHLFVFLEIKNERKVTKLKKMSEIVVYPEQISFDVRQQRTAKRVRITIKNLGNMSAKVTIIPPESDSFTLTDAKGKLIGGTVKYALTSESSQCIFIAKNSNVGIVPDDCVKIEGGKKPISVALRPAVSLVSVDELEAAIKQAPPKKTPSSARSALKESSRSAAPEEKVILQDGDETREIPSRSTFRRASKRSEKATDDLVFDEDDFIQNKRPKSDRPQFSSRSGSSARSMVSAVEEEEAGENQVEQNEQKESNELQPKITVAKRSKLPRPAAMSKEESPSKRSGIPRRMHHSNLPYTPDMDILEQSVHLKINSQTGEEESNDKPTIVNWYEDDAFDDLEEPGFDFELMMTAEGEDPIFCIDGDYYDSSGRLLTVQQGKPEVVFVTGQYEK